jgi:type I restriction enzyme, S subunit
VSEWRDVALGDLIHFQRGFDLTQKEVEPGPFPVISSGGVSYFTSRPKLDGPGVVTGRKGVLGKVFFADGPYWPHDTTLWVRDFKGNDPRFIYYWLQTVPLASLDGGAANPTLNRNHAHLLPARICGPSTQLRIAGVLSAFDDLIENNRRRIVLLEQMARAIYREWFVRFRYPGHEDDELVESPLGPLPASWQVKSLFDVADVGFGFALKSKGFGPLGAWPVIRIRDIPKGSTPTCTDEFPGDQYIVHDGDTLIGMDGDFHMCRWSGGQALLNQRVTRIRPEDDLGAEALYQALRAPIGEWNDRIVGTTVAHLGKRHLEQISVVVPPPSRAGALNEVLNSFGDLVLELRRTNTSLEKLRDHLLPKLVTGAIDVSHLALDALLDEPAA